MHSDCSAQLAETRHKLERESATVQQLRNALASAQRLLQEKRLAAGALEEQVNVQRAQVSQLRAEKEAKTQQLAELRQREKETDEQQKLAWAQTAEMEAHAMEAVDLASRLERAKEAEAAFVEKRQKMQAALQHYKVLVPLTVRI